MGLKRWILISAAAGLTLARPLGAFEPARAEPSSEFVRLMNLGKAYLENRDSKQAIEVLNKAVAIESVSAPAWRNLARAHFLAGHHERVLEVLKKAAELDPKCAATSYLAGLAQKRLSRFDRAASQFEEAVRLDPHTAALRFQLASAYQAIERHEQAVRQLQETIRLDGLHAGAQFKLSGYARKAGNRKDFQRYTQEFLRIRKLLGDSARSAVVLEQCSHTQPEALPEIGIGRESGRGRSIAVRFLDAADQMIPDGVKRGVTAVCVLDVDESGLPMLFVAEEGRGFSLLRMAPDGSVERTQLDVEWDGAGNVESCIVGDFHDDVPKAVKYDARVHALNDVLLLGPSELRLLKRTGKKRFRDVTEAAGLGGLTAQRAVWVDYDHDGDIDLFLARSTGAELRQNNGDGRFEDVTNQVGIGHTVSAHDVSAVDLDANMAVDLIVARKENSTLVFEGQRAGRFASMAEPPGPWLSAKWVLADDLNNDGHPDVLLLGDDEGVVILGRTSNRTRVDLSDVTPSGAALLDYDNDGWLDLCVWGTKPNAGEGGVVRLWRNVSRGHGEALKWSPVDEAVGLSAIRLPPVRHMVPVDFDGDGDTDLLAVTSDLRLRWLRNDGGHANGQLKVRLSTIKTNPSGIGTHLEVRNGSFLLTRSITGPVIEIGVGAVTRLDAVQILWTNGVVENQIDVAVSATPLAIAEKNVATGSCPFCYVWDGERFRFVTDVVGNSPIGLSLRRDVMLPADPDEFVRIGEADGFVPLLGAYTVKITEEYCETLYLDSTRLVAVDHPRDVEVHPTDKLMPESFPPSQLWGVTAFQPLREAAGDDGIDRTKALREIDGVFASPGPLLPPPFRGMCHPMTLTLDFGPIEASRPLVLVMTGWLRYGQASTNIALSQSPAHTVIGPTLEVEGPDGIWEAVDLIVGMPAGKTKTIVCDLSEKLPSGARRLRLTTTFELRWDRIALGEFVRLPDAGLHTLEPEEAGLAWRGFSELAVRAQGHPKTPDHDTVREQPPWLTVQEGWCTRYGDVIELVSEIDDKLLIVNAGDAVTLRFSADALPRIPDEHVRTFFLYTYGWAKDGDHNVIDGDTVGPLPQRSPDQARAEDNRENDWRARYNTRWVPRDRFHRKR